MVASAPHSASKTEEVDDDKRALGHRARSCSTASPSVIVSNHGSGAAIRPSHDDDAQIYDRFPMDSNSTFRWKGMKSVVQ